MPRVCLQRVQKMILQISDGADKEKLLEGVRKAVASVDKNCTVK